MGGVPWVPVAGIVLAMRRWRHREAELHLVASTDRPSPPKPGGRPPRWPWVATAADVLLVTATPGASTALEPFPVLHSMVTLGGFPRLVQLVAVSSLVLLVVLAVVSEGFHRLGERERSMLALAGMLSVVAGAGTVGLVLFWPVALVLPGAHSVGTAI